MTHPHEQWMHDRADQDEFFAEETEKDSEIDDEELPEYERSEDDHY